MNQTTLTLLKLGGSLITDKNLPHTARHDVLTRLADEIAAARRQNPHMPLILGHGSGSFGHVAASKYGTRQGVRSPEQWLGFVEVWKEARALNELVIQALLAARLPVIAFPPSAAVIAQNGRLVQWDLAPLKAALSAGLIPVVNGDVIFDTHRGGTIFSTEDLFFYLAQQFQAQRILLAGLEEGVWADFPTCSQLIDVITPASFSSQGNQIGGSASIDVTGGMRQKVESMLVLAEQIPGFEAQIFSGTAPGRLERVLSGEHSGTLILANR